MSTSTKKMLAMILAGGKGKRMDILCFGRPKPILPFAGGLNVIDFTLSNCIHSGINNFAALVDYQQHLMTDYLWRWVLANAHKTIFHVLEPKGSSYKGTADAIYQNLDYLERYNPEAVLILAGDHVYRMDYRKMLAFHEQMEAEVTVGVVSVPIEEAHRFGIVTINSQGRITDFAEKPIMPTGSLASMGIYIFNTKVLTEHLIEDSKQQTSPRDFGNIIIPKMVRRNRVFAYKFDGYWQDIGSIEAYYETNMGLTRELPSLRLNGKWPILTDDNGLLPLEISYQGSIKHSIVSTGCVIKGEVKNSILSPGVIIEEQAVVLNSIIMANAVIGSNSVVDRCILDEKVNVGKFCSIGFGISCSPTNRDITVLGKAMKIPSYSVVYPNCKVSANVGTANFIVNAVPSSSVVLQR